MSRISSSAMAIFGLLVGSLVILESALSIDFSAPVLVVIFQLDLFIFLISWYLILGLLAPWLKDKVWEETDMYDDTDNEISTGFLPLWVRFVLPVFLLAELLFLMVMLNGELPLSSAVIIGLYVLGPVMFLYYRSWLTLFISVLWVWFPIEWGVINDLLGNLSLSLIPLDALIGIFSLLWPLIVHGRHIPWYSWDLSMDDLKLVGKVSGALTVVIVPLGLLTRFITINPDNFLDPEITVGTNPVVNSLVYIILVFYLIFLVQGIMEETLFRDIIFKHQYYWLKDRFDVHWWDRIDLGHIMIALAGVLVVSIPSWDELIGGLVILFPALSPIADTVGTLALPLGEYEGRSIRAIEGDPLWAFYLLVAVLLVGISYLLYWRYHSPLMATLLVSSIIFGFAHFQDFRYVFFASIAGFGYGYTYYKSRNIVPAAMVHMGVDAVWVLLLNY